MNSIEKSNRRVEMSAVLSDAVYENEVSNSIQTSKVTTSVKTV